MTAQGVLIVNDHETPFQTETTVQLPNQFRNVIRVQGDRKTVFVNILNGDKMYFTHGRPAGEGERYAGGRAARDDAAQPGRPPGAAADGQVLHPGSLGEVKVENQPAVGVKATAKGRREVRLFFNRESGLLIKTEHAMDDGAGKEVVQEEMYSDFQDVEGYRRPMKMAVYRNGKKIMEAEVTDVKYLDKVDEAEFTKP